MRSLRPVLVASLLFVAACESDIPAPAGRGELLDPWELVLAADAGDGDVGHRIARLQERLRKGTGDALPALEQLGALFIARARSSCDPGFYTLAEQCAACIDARSSGHASALLLRGHVLHNQHRFQEAEAIARQLVAKRSGPLDLGLLGDVLLDRGLLREALDSYQRMLDQKPCLQSYARAARVRWLRGDLEGARQLLELAKGAGSTRDPESLSWTYARLAEVELQAGRLDDAKRACAAALELLPGSDLALGVRARIERVEGRPADAAASWRAAVERHPLPEHRWALADALRELGKIAEAEAAEAELDAKGASEDPRSFALYLATRGKSVPTALELVERELRQRQDVFTHDAYAWALLKAGEPERAQQAMTKALAEGTRDARLYYHAGAIAAANGANDDARRWLGEAESLRRTLLPSEDRDLRRIRASL